MNTYCINLKERPDRWKRTQDEAFKLVIWPTRFGAIKHERGHTGCTLSHLALLKQVKHEGQFMIIEDDIKVLKNGYDIAQDAFKELPDDWDLFYLGTTLNEPLVRYSNNLFRLKNAQATHAIMYNNQNGVADYIIENHNRNVVDLFYAQDVQEKFNCFITHPMAVTQRAGYSDIINKHTSYKQIRKRYKKFTR